MWRVRHQRPKTSLHRVMSDIHIYGKSVVKRGQYLISASHWAKVSVQPLYLLCDLCCASTFLFLHLLNGYSHDLHPGSCTGWFYLLYFNETHTNVVKWETNDHRAASQKRSSFELVDWIKLMALLGGVGIIQLIEGLRRTKQQRKIARCLTIHLGHGSSPGLLLASVLLVLRHQTLTRIWTTALWLSNLQTTPLVFMGLQLANADRGTSQPS